MGKKPGAGRMRIPNFNTVSTVIDRLTIENVKLAHFENAVEHDDLEREQLGTYEQRIAVQREAIAILKEELASMLEEVFVTREYRYLKEERTFK